MRQQLPTGALGSRGGHLAILAVALAVAACSGASDDSGSLPAASPAAAAEPSDQRPNLVLIVADDIRLKEPKKLELRFHPEQQTGRPDGAAFLFEGKTAVLRFEPLTTDSVEVEAASLAMEGRHGEKDLTMMTLRLTRTTGRWRNIVALSWAPSDRAAAKVTSETHGDVTTFHTGRRSFSLDWANSTALPTP